MQTMPAVDLRLADTVEVFDGPFGTAVVTKIDDDMITLFRPYATTDNFVYIGGVIPYIGIEIFKVPRNNATFNVYSRKELS